MAPPGMGHKLEKVSSMKSLEIRSPDTLAAIQNVLEAPVEYIKVWKQRHGKKVIGTLLTDIPEELIHACGIVPFALLDAKADRGAGMSVPSFSCSVVANALIQSSQETWDFLDGLVIPYLCDSSRSLFQIWQRNFAGRFCELLRLPRKLSSQGARTFLVKEFERFEMRLEEAFGARISNQEVWKSIETYNTNRRYLQKLKSTRSRDSNCFTNVRFFSLVKSSMLMPKEEHNAILEALLSQIDLSARAPEVPHPARVFLSGMFVEPFEIFQWMDEAGLVVGDDDLSVGSRYFSYAVEGQGDAIEALADSYFQRIPSPLLEGREDRLQFILTRVREEHLEGVVFIHLKFCEPLLFDYPDLKKGLDREGIPSLFVETDFRSLAEGQIKTRLQAFREVLDHRK